MFTIRPLTNADAARIVDLILPIQQQEFNVAINLAAQPDLLDIEAFYFRDGGHFWGAIDTDNGQLVGTVALLSIGQGAGALRKMFVRSAFRGKEFAIAQRLLDALIDYCVSHSISTLYLGTIDSMKAAHRFYERNGFTRIEKTALPAYYPNMAVDNMYYYRTINTFALS
ncbi:MAG TPA: GNAT family N-acetyltransferase [Puia sp.]|nr:GNAT family N-acetyltransferase [Puia sp.]